MKGKTLLTILLFSGMSVHAQLFNKPFIVGTEIHSGFNIPVYSALGYLIRDDIYAADLFVSFQSTGKDQWEKLYHFPRTGLGISAWTLGNSEILGNAYALYGFMNAPLTRNQRRVSLNVQPAAGAAYLPYRFDLRENPLNRAIGSNFNIYIRLALEGRLKLTSLCELTADAGLTHFSNGKTHSPNYGINIASVSMGINCLFNQENHVQSDPEIIPVSRKYVQSLFFSAGPKVYDNLYGNRYLSVTAAYDVGKHINNIAKAGLGADIFYDSSIGEALSENGVPEDDLIKLLRAGVHASYSMRYKRMLVGFQAGYYLYSKKIVLTRIYNRIFMQYMLTGKFACSLSIRSHWGKADSFEYGIGYIW